MRRFRDTTEFDFCAASSSDTIDVIMSNACGVAIKYPWILLFAIIFLWGAFALFLLKRLTRSDTEFLEQRVSQHHSSNLLSADYQGDR